MNDKNDNFKNIIEIDYSFFYIRLQSVVRDINV
jgi:hypothetical protein